MVKLCNNIDRNNYRIDFCISDKKIGAYENELTNLGCKIFRVTMKSESPIRCFRDIMSIVHNEKYENVLLVNEHSLSVLDLIAARCGGAKKCSMRSTNASIAGKKLKNMHRLFKPLSMSVPHVMMAPSTEAAIFTFGKRNVKNGNAHILKNGLQYEKYEFDTEKRTMLRNELKLENKFVIGHVGRFSAQKNHDFLIEIFYEISQNNENAVLLLVGTGEKQQEIIQKVKTLGIEEKILFLGTRTDVPELLSAMDMLLFPSFFEGMPNVVIEAQAAGLPCVISDSITKEAAITELVKYISLEKNATEWAGEALSHSSKFVRRSYKQEFYNAGYTIESVVKNFIDLVF